MFISNPPKLIHLTPYYILHLHTCSRPKASQQTGNDLEPLLFVVRWSKKKAQAQAHIFLFFIYFFFAPLRVSRLLLFILYLCYLFYFYFFPCSFSCFQAASLYSLFFISAFYFFNLFHIRTSLYSLSLALLRRQIE